MVGASESCVEALAGVETGQQSYFLKGVFAISRLANHALGIAQPIAVDQGVEVVAEMCGYGFGYVAWVDGQLLCYPAGGETGVAISSAALQHFAYLCIQRPGACLSLAGGLSGGMFTLRCHGVGLRFRGKGTKRRWKTLCRNAFSWWKISPALSKLFRCSVRNIFALPLFERGLVGNGGVLTKNNSRKVGLRELGGGGTGVLPVGCEMRYLTRYLRPSMM